MWPRDLPNVVRNEYTRDHMTKYERTGISLKLIRALSAIALAYSTARTFMDRDSDLQHVWIWYAAVSGLMVAVTGLIAGKRAASRK